MSLNTDKQASHISLFLTSLEAKDLYHLKYTTDKM